MVICRKENNFRQVYQINTPDYYAQDVYCIRALVRSTRDENKEVINLLHFLGIKCLLNSN